jgi:hypothetical protein
VVLAEDPIAALRKQALERAGKLRQGSAPGAAISAEGQPGVMIVPVPLAPEVAPAPPTPAEGPPRGAIGPVPGRAIEMRSVVEASPGTGLSVLTRQVAPMPMSVPSGTLAMGGRPFAALTLGEHDLDGVLVVLDYNNAVIKGRFNIKESRQDARVAGLWVSVLWSADASTTSTGQPVSADGSFVLDGLRPGEYKVVIRDATGTHLTETKNVVLKKNGEAELTFDLKPESK